MLSGENSQCEKMESPLPHGTCCPSSHVHTWCGGTRCAGSPLRKQDTGHVSYRWWGPLTRPLGLFCPYRGWQKGKCSEEWTREGGRVVKCRSKRFLPTLSPQPHPLAQTAKKFYLGIPQNRSCGDTCTAFGHLQYGWSPQPWRPEPLRATCLSLHGACPNSPYLDYPAHGEWAGLGLGRKPDWCGGICMDSPRCCRGKGPKCHLERTVHPHGSTRSVHAREMPSS